MMRRVCDLCLSEGRYSKATSKLEVKSKKGYETDLCDDCLKKATSFENVNDWTAIVDKLRAKIRSDQATKKGSP
ncbi:MAG: hypothetical protein WCK39_03855 [Methanomassiliicoccales archaeon]